VTKVATEPEEAKERVVRVLEAYWKTAFERTWTDLQPAAALARREGRLASALEEFFRSPCAPGTTGRRAGRSRRLQRFLGDVREAWVRPPFSIATGMDAFEEKGGTVVFLPYFDAAIAVDSEAAVAGAPEPDPALIFKALGDTTRFAIARLLAKRPTTSAELADQLALSRPTISHHVVVLREAGLLREESAAGSIVLHLAAALRDLSEAVLRRLADGPEGSAETRPIKTSRQRPRK
jgi:DNA-binding transcriptional ArsR family regulator